jgi:diacylglycerol kinase family enzyme
MDALVIFNPNASRVSDRTRAGVLRALGHQTFDVADTDHPGHAAELATQAAAEGRKLVVAVGGDGTANEAANGLVGTATALWTLPAGSTNVFARSLGSPDDLDVATAALAEHGEDPLVDRITTGTVDGRHFLFMAGVGVSAAVMRRAARRPVMRARMGVGYVAYGAAAALVDAQRGRLPRVVVDAHGREAVADSVIVQRSDPLTYFGRRPVHVCDPAHLGNGTLSAAMAADVRVGDVADIFRRLLDGRHTSVAGHPRVSTLDRLSDLEVRSQDGRPFDLEVDGTWVGLMREATFGVAPGSLLIARPRIAAGVAG